MNSEHDYPACGLFRGGKCSCHVADDASRHDAPDDVEVMYLVWSFQGHGSWTDATYEQYLNAKPDDRMAVVSLESYLAKCSVKEKQHQWNDDGERCLKCGDKDWMGGPCSG